MKLPWLDKVYGPVYQSRTHRGVDYFRINDLEELMRHCPTLVSPMQEQKDFDRLNRYLVDWSVHLISCPILAACPGGHVRIEEEDDDLEYWGCLECLIDLVEEEPDIPL